MPKELVGLILEYAAGHLWVGSMVDVKDQIGKWVFGRIIDVAEDAETKEVQRARNCHKCGALSSFDANECLICETPRQAEPKKPADSDDAPLLSEESLSRLGPGACMTRQGSDGPPTEADKLGTRVKISFYGWDEEFDEWVTLDRVRPGGTKITQAWLKPGNTVCLGEKGVEKMGASNMLMARVLELRPNPASVFDVKVQVDHSIPFSFRIAGERRDATEEELEGMWVGLNDGVILQNGSFNTCVIA
jgi:ribosomal protein L40E